MEILIRNNSFVFFKYCIMSWTIDMSFLQKSNGSIIDQIIVMLLDYLVNVTGDLGLNLFRLYLSELSEVLI